MLKVMFASVNDLSISGIICVSEVPVPAMEIVYVCRIDKINSWVVAHVKLITLIVKVLLTEELGLISSRESSESAVTHREAEEFLAAASPKKEPIQSEDPVADDPENLVIGLFIFRSRSFLIFKKGMVLCSAVFSPLDRTECFTLYPLADLFIPTPTWLLWESISHAAITRGDYSLILPPPSIATPGTHLYGWVNWGILKRTTMPKPRNGTEGHSNPGSLDCESSILPPSHGAPLFY